MKEELISFLETFCPGKVFLQGTLNPEEEYPSEFITFFTTDSGFEDFYDNEPRRIYRHFTVIYYSDDPSKVNTVPPQIIETLRASGFKPQNAGIDVISDVETHTGCAMEFLKAA